MPLRLPEVGWHGAPRPGAARVRRAPSIWHHYCPFYSLSLISDIWCQIHHLRMGVYHNYSPLGVDSTPNRCMGARMHSLGSLLFLLIRISCLDSVRPIGKVYSITLNTSLLPLQYRAPIHSRLIDRSLCWLAARCLLFSTGRCLSLGLRLLTWASTDPTAPYSRPGGAYLGLRSLTRLPRTHTPLDTDFSVVSWAHSLPFRY